MRSPSIQKLIESFPNLTREKAHVIRQLAQFVEEPDGKDRLRDLIEEKCPATYSYALRCFNDPFDTASRYKTMALTAIDEILGSYGIELLGEIDMKDGPMYEYCNMGDAYNTTLIYDRDKDRLFIGCWADIVEKKGL